MARSTFPAISWWPGAWAFSPLTADRPTASELLAFLGSPDPSPQGFTAGPSLIKGRASFLAARNLKHHKDPVQVLVPPDLDEDLEWAQQSSGPARPPAAPAAVESFAGAPPVFADSPVDDPRTAQDQVGAPAPGEQPGDRGKKAGFFGRRRESR